MTPDGAFDRRLTTWLEEDAALRAPQGFSEAVTESVNRERRLPSWATPERWISMEARARLGAVPRAVIPILTLSLLAAALAVSLAVAGAITNADGGGEPLGGLTYSTYDGDVYLLPSDGPGEPVRLAGIDEGAFLPRWSPDGTRFAYQSWAGRDGPITMTVRDADGSNPVVVGEPIAPHARGTKPNIHTWSPDGSRLVYAAKRLDDSDESPSCGLPTCGQWIWSAPTDGSELAQIIGVPELDAHAPVWTPDGKSIVFAGRPLGEIDYGIYRMDADGTNVEQIGDLTGRSGLDQLSISPDGSTLAVVAGAWAWDVYLVDLATGEDTLIDGEQGDDSEPFWSPDGSLIAFTTWGSADPQPMLYDLASGDVTSLDIPLYVLGWSPDGRSILGQWPDGILQMVDVTDPLAPVTTTIEGVADAEWPSWQPRP
jgi:Tol biopolymer transport system component